MPPCPGRALLAVPLAVVTLVACDDETEWVDAPPAPPPAVHAIERPKPPEKKVHAPARPGCDAVPVYFRGEPAGSICTEDAAKEGLTVVDLSDTWTPRVFESGEGKEAPEYAAKYLELAKSPNVELGLNGIAPAMQTLANRLADDARVRCDSAVDMAPVERVVLLRTGAKDDKEAGEILKQAKSRESLSAIQSQLVCAGLLKKASANGQLGNATHAALETFRRRHMIIGSALDADTVSALALGGDELAFRGLLRGLRERVADASGLIEDGTASEEHALVQGRELDLSRFAPALPEALDGGAPDLVDEATDIAARELGWTSPDAARAFLATLGKPGLRQLRVAVTLPEKPAYHGPEMDLRVEIDRGDVFLGPPGAVAALRKKRGRARSPSFVVYAKHEGRDIPLVRWATTIGGWKKDRNEDGEIRLKYKESDVGDRMWRQIIAAPAWMPPDSTPETDLLHEAEDGTVSLKRDLIQPGYRNAYGLVMLIHHEQTEDKEGEVAWNDHGIRTHGSVDYRSIKNGTSHGCHRLYNQLALRLSGYLLEHRKTVRKGRMRAGYQRTLEYNEQTIEVEVPNRGYLYELDPPVPIKVLRGNVIGDTDKPVSSIPIATDGVAG